MTETSFSYVLISKLNISCALLYPYNIYGSESGINKIKSYFYTKIFFTKKYPRFSQKHKLHQ